MQLSTHFVVPGHKYQYSVEKNIIPLRPYLKKIKDAGDPPL